MTDKEIIIDDINVIGCEFFDSEAYNSRNIDELDCDCLGVCENHLNCYYKQLARKEQECEELKDELSTYKKMLDNPEVRIALTDVRTGEREVWRKLGNKADRYKQAIKTINKGCIERVKHDLDNHVVDFAKQILGVINEVLRDE